MILLLLVSIIVSVPTHARCEVSYNHEVGESIGQVYCSSKSISDEDAYAYVTLKAHYDSMDEDGHSNVAKVYLTGVYQGGDKAIIYYSYVRFLGSHKKKKTVQGIARLLRLNNGYWVEEDSGSFMWMGNDPR